MRKNLQRIVTLVAASTLFVACDATENGHEPTSSDGSEQLEVSHDADEHEHDHNEHQDPGQHAPEEVDIEGLADHYHTGDNVELIAHFDDDTNYDHWHWYTRDDDHAEWETVPDHGTDQYTGEATVNGQEIKAVLFDDDHEAYVQSSVLEVVIDDHDHGHDHSHAHVEESQRIYDGFFYNDDVEERSLSDWSGDWQSVYPYLQEGALDEVFEHKANEAESNMTAEEYKEYYEVGYETNVGRIVIDEERFTFFEEDEEYTAEYGNDGFEILTYEAGNRGVRFIFEKYDGDEEMPQFIQFSDHEISPTDSHHFHLYWGDDREELLNEVTNWPTYYPSTMNEEEIVHEMIAH